MHYGTVHQMMEDRNSDIFLPNIYFIFYLTFKESVVILMEGFLAVTAVLEPHLLFLPAPALLAASASPSELTTPGDCLLPKDRQHMEMVEILILKHHLLLDFKLNNTVS